MYDFLWFSDSQRARIAPLLPTDVRRADLVDDRVDDRIVEDENSALLACVCLGICSRGLMV